jgi:hypothetical protein
MTRLLRVLCDPHTLEAIEGDLAELYGDRMSWRYARDVLSLCVRRPRAAVRSLVAACIVLGILGPRTRPIRYAVYANDPAGEFALHIRDGRAVFATLDGAPVRERDLLQSGDTLIIRGGDHGADFRIAIKPEGGITWDPRRSALP